MRTLALVLGLVVLLGVSAARAVDEEPPKMSFNDVKEIAPGVFFRYSSISATDKSVPFGGSNNIWVVFKDYVAVIDANFPKEAADVIAAIKKTTNKPIRYVFDTHHHGDHAYGNAVWAKEGAKVIASTNCGRLMDMRGPQQFAEAGRGPTGRKDVADSTLKTPDIRFDEKYVLDDGEQRIEFIHFGHMHTPGDAVAYLPRHRIVCTGDACVNGAFNFMGHSDSASWIRCLEMIEKLDIKFVCPGHGPVARKDLLGRQKRYFQDMRAQIRKGIDAGKSVEDITKSLDMPWYKEWTGKDAREIADNVKHVHDELMGKVNHRDLGLLLDAYEGPSYCKATPGWKEPRRIVVPNLSPVRLAELKAAAPRIQFLVARTSAEATRLVVDADAVLGYCSADLLRAGQSLRWVQMGAESVERDLREQLGGAGLSVTHVPSAFRGEGEDDRTWELCVENVRRFADGRRLLCVLENK